MLESAGIGSCIEQMSWRTLLPYTAVLALRPVHSLPPLFEQLGKSGRAVRKEKKLMLRL